MKQAAGEKASVAGSRSPPGSLCEDRLRDSAEDTTLGHRDNAAPLNSEQASVGGEFQTPPCCSRMRTSDS